MKKTKFHVLSIALLTAFSTCFGLSGYSVQAANTANTTFKSTSSAPYAIDKPELWEPLSGFKLDPNMKNYFTGFHDSDYGISAGYGGNVYYTQDCGATWTKGKNVSLCSYGLDIIDYDQAWICGNGGNIRVTKDSGKSWKSVTNFGDNEPGQCRFISFIDGKSGWIASPGKLASTSDGGKKWTQLKLPKGLKKIAAIKLIAKANGYLLSTDGYLFTTSNGGKTWASRDLGIKKLGITSGTITEQNSPSAAVSFFTPKFGMVVFHAKANNGSSVICDLRTYDSGKTWKPFVIPCKFKAPSIFISGNGSIMTLAERNTKDSKQRDNVNVYFNQLPIALD